MHVVRSKWEEALAFHIKLAQLPAPSREFKFDPHRKWRLDFAWPKEKVGCEVDGGLWKSGRHVQAQGFEHDCEKFNALVVGGWRCLRFTSQQVRNGYALNLLEQLLSRPTMLRS